MLPILFFAFCLTMFGCADWFGNDDDDDDPKSSSAGAAPNIYLYPEIAGEISVKFTFMDDIGGFTHTEPEYGADGWHVWVEPDGLIDDTYDYLYYAAVVATKWQKSEGWAVQEENLFQWFENTMLEMGFNQNETDDFIEYWTDNLPLSPCYHIYPQDTEQANARIAVDIEPEPDTLKRMWFYIEKTDHCEALLEPEEIVPFERNGFTVVEWGVYMPLEDEE